MNKNVHTILGCEGEYEESGIVIFGAPFDSTTSYRPGARFASSALRNESFGMETYSPYQDKDMTDFSFFDAGDLELPFGDPKAALEMIEQMTETILNDNKMPLMIGGEHLVTLGAVRSAAKKYPDLHILHFDAHADIREEYLGAALSHATVMRRCHDLLGDDRIYQFGIRSGDRDEFKWGREHVSTCRFDFSALPDALEKLKGKPVYVTIDLDVLDPSVFPGTGTPEAGGVSYMDLMNALSMISVLQIKGIDMNELSPVYDASGSSTALACKLLREILLFIS